MVIAESLLCLRLGLTPLTEKVGQVAQCQIKVKDRIASRTSRVASPVDL